MNEQVHAVPDLSEPPGLPEGIPLRVLKTIDRGILKVEKVLLFLLVVFIVVAVTAQIVTRFANITFAGGMEAGVFAMFLIALLSGSVATHYRRHITVDIAARIINSPTRTVLSLIINAIGFVLMLYLVRVSVFYVNVNRLGGEYNSPALDIPYWWLQAALPVVFTIMAFRFFLNGVEDAKRVRTRQWLPQDVHAHGADIRM
jgi:TRAP-type C4-dicarboxylate transport system permease small subunit